MKNIVVLIIILIHVLSCASTSELESNPKPFFGRVYDQYNKAIQNVVITLNDSTVAVSDINGRYTFAGLLIGLNSLEFHKDGYISQKQDITYDGSTQLHHVRMETLASWKNKILDALKSKNIEAFTLLIEASHCTEDPEVWFIQAMHAVVTNDDFAFQEAMRKLQKTSFSSEMLQLLVLNKKQFFMDYSHDPILKEGSL